MGYSPTPRVRSADGGDDCRRDAPNLCIPRPHSRRARRSTASERNREEPRVLTRLDAQQDRPLAARAGIREGLAHFFRARDALAGDIEDHVPGAEALRGGRTVGIDLRDHDALAAGARDLAGRSEREAELRHFGAAVVVPLRRRARLTLLARQLTERDVDGLLRALADDAELDVGAGRQAGDLLGEIACVLDLLAIDRSDDVAGLDAGLDGRPVGLRLSDQRAFRLLQAE